MVAPHNRHVHVQVWFCRRSFGVPTQDSDELVFKLYDKNILKDGFIGHVRIQVARLSVESTDFPITLRTTTKMRLSNCRTSPEPPTLRIRRLLVDTAEIHKTIYFVRHGTSFWNQAQTDKDYGKLLGL